MASVTRCPACGTAFRVLPDQLRVSNGWVRCGDCREVFNARQTLTDPDGAEDPAGTAPPARGAVAPARPRPARLHWRRNPPYAAAAHIESAAASAYRSADAAGPSTLLPGGPPTFLQQAARAERWRQPRWRWALRATAVLLALALGLQVAWRQREPLAQRWLPARALFSAWCRQGCSPPAPRELSKLGLESSDLKQTAQPGVLRLSASLHNGADVALRVPDLELTLTDALGHVLARKVLAPRDLGITTGSMAARSTLDLESLLNIGALQVAGFTAEVFYP